MNYSLALRWKAKKNVANAEDFRSMPEVSTCLPFKTICNGTLGNEWMAQGWPAKSFNYWALTTKKICRYHRKHEDIIMTSTLFTWIRFFFWDYSSARPSMTYILHKNGRELGSLFKKARSVRNFGLIIRIANSN